MKVKTLTGPSIHAALMEARRVLGDNVVLLESVPAQGDEPARITVMTDATTAAPAQPKQQEVATATPRYGYSQARQRNTARAMAAAAGVGAGDADLPERPATDGEVHIPFAPTEAPTSFGPMVYTPGTQGDGMGQAGSGGRNQLFPVPQETSFLPAPANQLEELLEAQLKTIHERLETLDRRFESAIIGASQRWIAHPLFTKLLRQGMRPATVSKFFEALVTKGHDPDAPRKEIRWALAQEIRDALHMTVPKRFSGTTLFIGPSGAGKTTLMLKAATHPNFFGRHNVMVISIMPEDVRALPYQDPADFFRNFGVPVQSVSNEEEMKRALEQGQAFDQLLIDTPPMPVHPVAARKMLLYLKRLIEPFMPLQIHLVLNATRALEDFSPEYLNRMPLQPDALALTHLDETASWGRIAEWMMQIQKPVQYASSSARVPDGVGAFSPTWFVEEMMKLV